MPNVAERFSSVSTSSSSPAATTRALAQQQPVAEARRDLLDVVRHQDRGRRVRVHGQHGQRRDEVLAAAEVEAGGRLVEEEQLGVGHQRPGDLHPLALALAEGPERPVGQLGDAELARAARWRGRGRGRRTPRASGRPRRTTRRRRRRGPARRAGSARPAPRWSGRSAAAARRRRRCRAPPRGCRRRPRWGGSGRRRPGAAWSCRRRWGPRIDPALVLLDDPVDRVEQHRLAPPDRHPGELDHGGHGRHPMRWPTAQRSVPGVLSPLPASVRLAWWGTAWLRGHVVADELIDAVVGDDATHLLGGPRRHPRAAGHRPRGAPRRGAPTPIGAALPAEGDLVGLGGPAGVQHRRTGGRRGGARARRGVVRGHRTGARAGRRGGDLAPDARRAAPAPRRRRGRPRAADRAAGGRRDARPARGGPLAPRGRRPADEPAAPARASSRPPGVPDPLRRPRRPRAPGARDRRARAGGRRRRADGARGRRPALRDRAAGPGRPPGAGRRGVARRSGRRARGARAGTTPSTLPLGSGKWNRRPPGKSNGPSTTSPPAARTACSLASRSSEMHQDQRVTSGLAARGETADLAVTVGGHDPGVVRAVVVEAPAEGGGVERLGRREVGDARSRRSRWSGGDGSCHPPWTLPPTGRRAAIASTAMDVHHAERRPDTLLITLTGKDRPGVSSADLRHALARGRRGRRHRADRAPAPAGPRRAGHRAAGLEEAPGRRRGDRRRPRHARRGRARQRRQQAAAHGPLARDGHRHPAQGVGDGRDRRADRRQRRQHRPDRADGALPGHRDRPARLGRRPRGAARRPSPPRPPPRASTSPSSPPTCCAAACG